MNSEEFGFSAPYSPLTTASSFIIISFYCPSGKVQEEKTLYQVTNMAGLRLCLGGE